MRPHVIARLYLREGQRLLQGHTRLSKQQTQNEFSLHVFLFQHIYSNPKYFVNIIKCPIVESKETGHPIHVSSAEILKANVFSKVLEVRLPLPMTEKAGKPCCLPQVYEQIDGFQMNNFPGSAVLRILETTDIDYKITENKTKIKPGATAGQTHGDRLPSCSQGIFKVQAGLEPKIKKLANLKCYRSITSNSPSVKGHSLPLDTLDLGQNRFSQREARKSC